MKTHPLPLMSSPNNSFNDSPSRGQTTSLSPDEDTLRQIQQMAVHTTNIVRAVSMFNPGDETNNSDDK
jgi:hypothetical protein